MNWQALNPLRLVGATKNAFTAVRPHLTRNRLIAAAATGLIGSAGATGYSLYFRTGRAVVQAVKPDATGESVDPAVALANRGDGKPVAPIPDPGDGDGAGAVRPSRGFSNNQYVAAEGDAANGDPEAARSFGSDSGGIRPSNSLRGAGRGLSDDTTAGVGDTQGEGAPVEDGAVAETEGAPDPNAVAESANDNGVSSADAGTSEQVAAQSEATGGAAAGMEPESPVGIPAESNPQLPPPPAGIAADTADANASNATGAADEQPAAAPPARGFNSSSAATPNDAADAGARETEPPRDLVPVDPTRLQPPPAEENVRVPEEAVPSLAPGRAMTVPPTTVPPGSGFNSSGRDATALDPRSRPLPDAPRAPGAGLAAGGAAVGLGGAAALGSSGAAALPGAAGSLGAAGSVGSAIVEGSVSAVGQPGAKHLEGTQTPALLLEKLAPAEIQVGHPATFAVKVRNTGRVAAHQVVIVDQVPQGTRLLETTPRAQQGAEGSLRWQLGTLEPGQEVAVTMQLMPEQEGEVGSVAQVTFQSQASVRTVATRPQVSIEHRAPQKVLIGQSFVIQLVVTNTGTGAANNLVIEEAVPEGLGHPAGPELEYPIGTLRPNETKRVELTLKALKPGQFQNLLIARTETQALAEARVPVEVQAPQMAVGLTGPKVRYLDRQATYNVSVSNQGTAPATNLEIVAHLPRGLKFVSADHHGQYDPQRHVVLWGLAELPPGVAGTSQLVVVPTEPGEQRLKVEGRGDLNLEHAFEQAVVVETLSELQFAVADTADPIEVGSSTTYDLRVMNRGSRSASNVQLVVEIPSELEPVGGEGPTRVTANNGQLTIEPIGKLAPGAQVAYQLQVRGVRKGDPRIRVRLTSDESPNPVTKEESTRVYADE